MEPKLSMLFLLIGSIISLSYLSDEAVAKLKAIMQRRDWRALLLPRRRA